MALTSLLDSHKKKVIEEEFSHIRAIYFNSAYFGPSPLRAKKKVEEALERELNPAFYEYDAWMAIPERIRGKIANLLQCSPDRIAHTTSVSDVMNLLANGDILKKGDVVCSMDREYPSNVLPWMLAQKNYGISFQLLRSPLPTAEWLRKELPAKTKIFNISHVAFDSGRKIDLLSIGKLMRERNILFVVDATQSLGGLPISPEELEYIDVLACSTYKWMLGPYGTAFAYFSDRALREIRHTNANWIKSPKSKVVYSLLDYTIETLPGARKFDRGQSPNMLAMSCLEASLDFFLEMGLDQVAQHNRQIRDYFLSLFPKKNFQLITPQEAMGNIIGIKSISSKDPAQLEKDLKGHNIDVSVREGNIRLSFHIFNQAEQVETLVQTLE